MDNNILETNLEQNKWETFFLEAKKYYKEFNNLLVPSSYVTPNGLQLGVWIQKQRNNYRYGEKDDIVKEQIAKLETIEMVWDVREYNWQKNFGYAKSFYEKHHHLRIPYDYIIDDCNIGKWIHTQRKAYKHQGNCKISDEHIGQLEQIDMIWDIAEADWECNYNILKSYYKKHGNINIKSSYKTQNGIELGFWLWSLKKDYQKGKLPKKQVIALEELDIQWETTKTTISVIEWIREQENLKEESPTSISQKQLQALPENKKLFNLSHDKWDIYYNLAKDYLSNNKINTIPPNLVIDKYKIGEWFVIQRNLYKTKQLSKTQQKKFHQLLYKNNAKTLFKQMSNHIDNSRKVNVL